ncbi:MAG: hypothetical protein KDA99_24830, partial [Planctomycetales bacterium]|nr:hypothetical protein [Planctomycetales bacterium]
MRVTTLTRKLRTALIAGGLLLPTPLWSAELNTNLVVNPSFENVDINDTGPFTSVRLLDWIDPTPGGGDLGDDSYSYPYSSNYSGSPAPPGAGDYHFSGGFNTTPGEVMLTQTIDLSAGPTGSLIATGNAAFNLGAYFSTYQTQNDFSSVHVRFLDVADSEVGSSMVGSEEFRLSLPVTGIQTDWGLDVTAGLIPSSTRKAEIQITSIDADVNHDGYLDLIDFRVTEELILPTLDITIDRDSGNIVLTNQTGTAVNLSGYSVTSASGALNPSAWQSIADHYDADSGSAGNFVDSAHVWTVLSAAGAVSDLSEADLDSGMGANLPAKASITLGSADTWLANPTEDVLFGYVSNGQVISGIVTFTGNGGQGFAVGDLNTDGQIDGLDWAVVRSNQHTTLSQTNAIDAYLHGDLDGDGKNNHADFVLFRQLYDDAHG